MRLWLLGGIAVVVLILAATGFVLASSGTPAATPTPSAASSAQPSSSAAASAAAPATAAAALPGMNAGAPPWPAETANLLARLNAIGLPALTSEGTVLHIHQHLDIIIDGTPVTVPADIGINATAGFLSEIHTHDASGVIHVESPTNRTFRLGEFFDIWGLRFDSSCIGGECSGGGRTLAVFVNGHRVSGDPRQVILAEHQEIAIIVGTPDQLTNPPSTFDWAGSGL